MIRTKGEPGTGNIVEGVRHLRAMQTQMRRLTTLSPEELMTEAKTLGAPYDLIRQIAKTGQLPVPHFAAGGVATPADAALCMALGAQSVFVGKRHFLERSTCASRSRHRRGGNALARRRPPRRIERRFGHLDARP